MNIWEGKFPSENLLLDGHHGMDFDIFVHESTRPISMSSTDFLITLLYLVGAAPVGSYRAQTPSGLHNMLGNVWEWVRAARDNKVTSKKRANIQRVLRGGSFIDSYVKE